MASVSIYLNFIGNCEEAFIYYKTVFGGEFFGEGIMRFGNMPAQEGMPPISENEKNKVLHVTLPIMGGCFHLMGCDVLDSMGFTINQGNNVYINLEPDTRTETDRIFAALSSGGNVEMTLQDTFWGAYFGSCSDKFGIRWMINCMAKE